MSRETPKQKLITELGLAVREAQAAVDEMDEAASRALGINRTDARCLDVIQREEPVTPGYLAERSGLTTAAVTTVLDRMERAGYVTRERDTEDRRRVLVRLTPLANERIIALYGPFADFREAIERYTLEELRLLRDFHLRSRDYNRQVAAKAREVSFEDPRTR
jgi:DNA-binding MarR family transcriptional regulator